MIEPTPERLLDSSRVLVVGSGFAALGAAWAAARIGARVMLVSSGTGSSGLYSGMVDGPPPSAEALELATRLGLVLGAGPRALATREGVVRSAAGRDRALLDLDAVSGREVAVADFGRDDFDAALLASSFATSAWAQKSQTGFVAVPIQVLTAGFERRIPAYDLASRFDDPLRRQALAAALRAARSDAAAWLLGPWLGIHSEVADELAQTLSCPVGETSSAPGGAAGARFELRRDALLSELGVRCLEAQVDIVARTGQGFRIALADGIELEARAVVLALGGVAAGGIAFEADGAQRGFRLSLRAEAPLRLDGEFLEAASSLWGMSLVRLGLSSLERVGVQADRVGRVGSTPGLFACGDVVAGRTRNVLEALGSGILAGRGAALEPGN
jgi:anaerobic glycerol-3-phosphate dehydrogenase